MIVQDVQCINHGQSRAQASQQAARSNQRQLGPYGRGRQDRFADNGGANVAVVLLQVDVRDLIEQYVSQVAEPAQIVLQDFQPRHVAVQVDGLMTGLLEAVSQRILVLHCFVQSLLHHLREHGPQLPVANTQQLLVEPGLIIGQITRSHADAILNGHHARMRRSEETLQGSQLGLAIEQRFFQIALRFDVARSHAESGQQELATDDAFQREQLRTQIVAIAEGRVERALRGLQLDAFLLCFHQCFVQADGALHHRVHNVAAGANAQVAKPASRLEHFVFLG